MSALLYFIELNDTKNFEEYEKYLKFINAEKKAQMQKFRLGEDKKLSLLSDLFVRYLACTLLNLVNDALVFEKNSYGKPYLQGFPGFQYNISHTRNAIVVGIFEKQIGVDIERIKTTDLKIANRFFCKNEVEYILTNKVEKDKSFYEVWTKKEAYVKWLGKGLSLPLNAFDVTSVNIDAMLTSIVINDYMVSVCCDSHFDRSNLEQLTEKQAFEIISKHDCFCSF